MPVKILMPALSPTMTEGKLTKWLKSEGDDIVSGDVIAEIETDKATMEVEAVDEGTLARIVIAEGTENVPVNDVIAVLLEDGEDDSAVDTALANDDTKTPEPNTEKQETAAEKTAEKSTEKTAAQTPAPRSAPAETSGGNADRIIASPLARRMAKNNNIDLSHVTGSGPRGRIVKSDIEDILSGKAPITQGMNTQQTATPRTATGPDAAQLAEMLDIPHHLEENSGMRKTIAARLLESKQTVPHYYLSVDCNLDKLLAARKEINTAGDGLFKISVNDFIIKASAMALKKVPTANVSWTDQAMVVYDRADISVAVATPGGLITPIVKDADNKSLKVISEEVKDLATRARDGKLKPEEYQGGTFSLSNLGMFGISQFSAIINPPQACILAVGAGEQRAIVKDGAVVPATMMTCTASFDHRAIDGAVGAELLSAFKTFIENPLSMLA